MKRLELTDMDYVVAVLLDTLLTGTALWVSAKLTAVAVTFRDAFVAAALASLMTFVPGILGWALSIIVLFYLLKKLTRASVWPDLILMVVVSKLISWLLVFSLLEIGTGAV